MSDVERRRRVLAILDVAQHRKGQYLSFAVSEALADAVLAWADTETAQLRAQVEAERTKFQAETLTTAFLAQRLRGDHPQLCTFCPKPGNAVWVGPGSTRYWLCDAHLNPRPGLRFGAALAVGGDPIQQPRDETVCDHGCAACWIEQHRDHDIGMRHEDGSLYSATCHDCNVGWHRPVGVLHPQPEEGDWWAATRARSPAQPKEQP